MKKLLDGQAIFALILVALSAVFYALHYLLFHDLHHIFLYLIGDIAFLFVDVLIVMLVLHRLLEYREKQAILKKLNMVIGTFFIEMGTELMKRLARFGAQTDTLQQALIVTQQWSEPEFAKARKTIGSVEFKNGQWRGDLPELREYLHGKRPFLLSLLENPNLLEHEVFTDLLWAVFHLTDELMHRTKLTDMPETDYRHLAVDIDRAYQQLVIQWLEYMRHLKRDYPYLFSLAVRTNPFDAQASVEVRS